MLIWLTPLQMSLYGGLAVLAALAVRTAGRRRLPSGVLSWLWLLAALRFLLPVSVSGPASVDVSALLPRPLPSVSLPAPLPGTAAADAEALPAAPDGLDVPWPVLVWAAGALVLAALFAGLWLSWRLRLRRARPCRRPAVEAWLAGRSGRRLRVLEHPGLTTPMACGLFRPAILLPPGVPEEALPLVLLHESVHLARRDNLKRGLSLLVVCLHWYNPLAWVLAVFLARDVELDCDKAVLARAGRDCRAEYASTLVSAAARPARSSPYPCYGKHAIKERVVTIMTWKKPTRRRCVLAAVLLAAFGIGLLTGFAAVSRQGEPDVPVFPQGEGVVGLGNREPPDDLNAFGLSGAVLNIGDYWDIPVEIKNGVMCQFRDGGQPWTLAEGETVRFSLTAGLVEGYEERGQPMEIGVLRDGARVPLFNGNLNVTMDMHFTAPADGSYEFYLLNVCADSIYLLDVSVQ